MAVIEATVGRLIGFLLELVGRSLAGRPAVRIRIGVREAPGITAAWEGSGGLTAWDRDGALRIYNAGSRNFTVDEAGWRAQDGTRVTGRFYDGASRTVEPGGPGLVVTLDASELVTLHEEHGGIAEAYVTLAGEDRPRRKRVDEKWIADLRAAASRPSVSEW
jgi:hypothetical protein